MPVNSDDNLIEIRPDERFDEARLQAYLRGRLPGAAEPMSVRQSAAEKPNLTYLLSFGASHEYVLRRPPLGPYAPTAHDMGREHRVLSVLPRAFPFAPARLYVLRRRKCARRAIFHHGALPWRRRARCHARPVRRRSRCAAEDERGPG